MIGMTIAPLSAPPLLNSKSYDLKAKFSDACQRAGISVDDARSRSQLRILSSKRHHAMAILHDEYKLSFPRIGRMFERDHSSVFHGVRSHNNRVAYRKDEKALYHEKIMKDATRLELKRQDSRMRRERAKQAAQIMEAA